MSIKKAARHAEVFFNTLCAAWGATCNAAIEDERGWDFFVQFPERPRKALAEPLDMQTVASGCLVQVKSTQGEPTGVTLKLSNAREFAKNRMPCFVVLFPYKDGALPNHVYLLHFWEKEIARALKKVRALDAKGNASLHRAKLRFPLAVMTRVESVDLLSTIEHMTNERGSSYAEFKRTLSENVGFDDGSWQGSVTFQAGIEEIVDMAIGVTNHRLPASSISIRSVRFGIPAGTAAVDDVPGHVSFRAQPRKCTVVVSSEPHGHEVSLACDLFVPAIPGLKPEQVKYRVTHPFLELLVTQADHHAQFRANASLDDRHTLSDIGTLIDLMHVFASPRLHFRLNVDGRRILGGTGNSNRSMPISLEIFRAGQFVSFLNANTKPHDVPDGLRFCISDLIQRANDVAEFCGSAIEDSMSGSMAFDIDQNIAEFSGRALLWPCVEVPGYCAYAIVKRAVKIKPTGKGRISFALGPIDYARVRILSGGRANTEQIIIKELEACLRQAEDKDIIAWPRRRLGTHVQIADIEPAVG